MNIRQAKEEIKNTIRAYGLKTPSGEPLIPYYRQRPILMMGPPGIGKTRIMEQISQELDIGLASYALTHHTRQSALGLPEIVEEEFEGDRYTATRYTMSEIISGIYHVMRKTGKREGILFLDEINCISETLVPAMLQLLQQKTFGGRPIPPGWIIVAAGNPPEYNRSARRFDIVTLDRIRLLEIEADREVWKSYATDAGVHGAVMSFLELKPQNFFSIKKTVDGISYATPRGWEDLSGLMKAYESAEVPITREVVGEFIHDYDISEDMAIYYELYNRYRDNYHVDDILNGEAPASVYERLLTAPYDERVSLIRLILDALILRFDDVGTDPNGSEGTDPNGGEGTDPNGDVGTDPNGSTPKNEPITPSPGSIALKAAFDFIVETMGEGNELLLFVTGLTDSTASVMYMLSNPSPEYLKYSDELLGDGKRAEILKSL